MGDIQSNVERPLCTVKRNINFKQIYDVIGLDKKTQQPCLKLKILRGSSK